MRPMKPDKEISVSTIRIPTASGSIPALVLAPKTGAENAVGVLWIHGGGYIAGMKEMVHASRAVDLVKKFGAVVVSPGYRLAVQRPYPAAAEDCYSALIYMKNHARELGIRRGKRGRRPVRGGVPDGEGQGVRQHRVSYYFLIKIKILIRK